MSLAWVHGEPWVARVVARWADADDGSPDVVGATVLADSRQRRIVHLQPEDGPPLLIKHYRVRTGPHPLRQRIKHRLGRTQPQLEWRALTMCRHAGLAVPEPLAKAKRSDGDWLVVESFVTGPALAELAKHPRALRRRALAALGEAVRGLHSAGIVHGDLHPENVIISEPGPVFIDFQRCHRSKARRAQLADFSEMDFGLWVHGFSATDRLHWRLVVTGCDSVSAPGARERLRAIGAAAEKRAHEYGRAHTRRCNRPSSEIARIDWGDDRGLRVADYPEKAVRAAVAAHRSGSGASDHVLKDDHRARVTASTALGRPVVVKEVTKGGARRLLADLFRGSAARRSWVAGHGMLARGLAVTTPLAFVERRVLGIPVWSAVILEDARPSGPLDSHGDAIAPDEISRAVVSLLHRLHQRNVDHGDLQALHIYVDPARDGLAPTLIDLDGVRFRTRLTQADRIRSLAAVNASMPEALWPASARLAAFRRYCQWHPFDVGEQAALTQVIAASLARKRAWRGRDCESRLVRRRQEPA